jgi:hypothetical protein
VAKVQKISKSGKAWWRLTGNARHDSYKYSRFFKIPCLGFTPKRCTSSLQKARTWQSQPKQTDVCFTTKTQKTGTCFSRILNKTGICLQLLYFRQKKQPK